MNNARLDNTAMMAEAERLLEFDKIVRLLASHTQSEPGRELAQALTSLDDDAAVQRSLAEISEVVKLLLHSKGPALGGLSDLRSTLKSLRAKGSWLDAEALQAVLSCLETASACCRYFRNHDDVPQLLTHVDRIDPLGSLAATLRSCIDNNGEILDSSSNDLAAIRNEIRTLRNRVRQQLEQMLSSDQLAEALQDRIITERNGRYVLPIKANFKGKVKGFVHDSSASGQTLFIEPARTLEKNNRLQALRREEQQEVVRILQELSGLVAEEREQLLVNQEVLAHLDLRSAAGRFSKSYNGQVPHLVDEPLLDLRQAKHPLLLFDPAGEPVQDQIIPIDLRLGENGKVLVVSGPNTGGKTVALKTAGLLLLMLKAGLHIPCHPDSRVHLFGRLFADIGDEQSIEAHLSTFSGHLVRLRHILDQADGDSLILFDEAGTGTDPGEGAALIIAAIDDLRERGSRVLLTTHLNLLKGYAQLHDDVENAAVEFDRQTLRPTYRLHYGIPGESGAFTIARHFGLPDDILQRAESYLGRGEQEGRELIGRLNDLVKTLDAERAEAAQQLATARSERNKRKQLLNEIEQQRTKLLDKSLRKGEQLVREAEREVKALLAKAGRSERLPEQAEVVAAIKDVGKKLEQKKVAPAPRLKALKDVKPGEVLHVPNLKVDGEVTQVSGSRIELDVQGKKLRLDAGQLEQYEPRRYATRKKQATVKKSVSRERFEPRLLLVGKRVDAALPELERFLDDALLHGVDEVEVVHGSGEGILRKAVRESLARHGSVVAFHAAGPNQGGDNVTVIEMRAK